MPNTFTPQRLTGESQADYAARRREARDAVRLMRCIGLGDQHQSPSQREDMRANQRKARKGTSRPYGRFLLVAQERRNTMRMQQIHKLRDAYGEAFTMTGRPRRMWVAGVSAQRGF